MRRLRLGASMPRAFDPSSTQQLLHSRPTEPPMTATKSTNIHWHAGNLSRAERWGALKAKGCTLWFTGLSASGKSTIASALEQHLVNSGINCYRLDGDNIRFGLNKN